MSEDRDSERRSRIRFLSIVAIAFVPIGVAYFVFFYFPALLPESTTNQGILVRPSVQMPTDILLSNSQWSLLLPVGDDCDATCEQVLYLSRQVHVGLGKDAARLRRLVISTGELSQRFHELLIESHQKVAILDPDPRILALLNGIITDATARSIVFLIDPNGNVMMYYRPDQGGKPMLKDLKHLLKISNIG